MTAYSVTGSVNYAAEVIEVKSINVLQGLDNLVGITAGGQQALVPKTTQVGDVLVVFPAESRLSHEFASANNLYRHSELNADPSQTGYLEDNRRVRAIRLRGEKSTALALTLDSIVLMKKSEGGWLLDTDDVAALVPGVIFDTVNGVVISEKYELPVKSGNLGKSAQEKAWKRVDSIFLPEHIDTDNYWRNAHKIDPSDHIVVTQKIHGTSIRLGHTIVKRKLTWVERLAKRLGVQVAETEFDYVFGSRKVIKDPHNPNQDHFYSYDIWSEEGQKYEHLLPKNVVVYGELIGWTKDGAPIQQGYTYNVPKGEAHLYVYRVAVVTADGAMFDLSWNGVKEFCRERGLNVVPELWDGQHGWFIPEDWTDWGFYPDCPHALPLSDKGTVDEGVVVRRDGVLPYVLKAKSPIFLGHETALLDKEVEVLS